MVVIEQNR